MSVRIAGGALGGRLLSGPPRARARGAGVPGARPTAVRLRQSLFAVLAEELVGARVLDACAGVGTLGFEAISRGAVECVFVERSPRLARVLERNAERLGVEGCRVVVGDAARELRRLRNGGAGFGVVLLDPPWEDWETGAALPMLAAAVAVAPLVVAEHRASWSPPEAVPVPETASPGGVAARPPGVCATRTRTTAIGDGAFSLYRRDTAA